MVAGNHDLTLDRGFYGENWAGFHNQRREDMERCGGLLRDSGTLIYLEHEARSVVLVREGGPQTRFTVFGSPYSPAHGSWAFGYPEEEAERLWGNIPLDTDILVTHTPPLNHCDKVKDGRTGCAALSRRLGQVQPRLHICGHIHEGRGGESVSWRDDGTEKRVRYWKDPGLGEGNKKQSLLSLLPGKPSEWFNTRAARSKAKADRWRPQSSALSEQGDDDNDGLSSASSSSGSTDGEEKQTCVVNAAIMQNSHGGPKRQNKPIVVDIELPV